MILLNGIAGICVPVVLRLSYICVCQYACECMYCEINQIKPETSLKMDAKESKRKPNFNSIQWHKHNF